MDLPSSTTTNAFTGAVRGAEVGDGEIAGSNGGLAAKRSSPASRLRGGKQGLLGGGGFCWKVAGLAKPPKTMTEKGVHRKNLGF